MKNILHSLYTLIAITAMATVLTSCTDKIDISTDTGTSQINVDASLYSHISTQTIYLSKTAGTFNQGLNPALSGVVVTVTDNIGNTYNFNETNKGTYVATGFQPVVGRTYNLSIKVGAFTYSATSTVPRLPQMDSLAWKPKENNGFGKKDGGYEVDLGVKDPVGLGDNYRLKIWHYGLPAINDSITQTNDIDVINDSDINWDGLKFIYPISSDINFFTYQPNRNFAATSTRPGYNGPDSLKLWIMTMDKPAYDFLNDAATERTNGGLFASPPYNVHCNIKGGDGAVQNTAIGSFIVYGVREVHAICPVNVKF